MLIREIMQKDLVTALQTATLRDVTRKMAEQKIGSVLIVDEKRQLKGILTDRDVALAVAADGKDPRTCCASDIMSEAPLCAEFDTDIESALQRMNSAHTRRLPITEQGNLVGVVSSTDLACALKDQFNQFLGLEETYLRH